MPSIADLKKSSYLTKEDVDPPVVVTITGYDEVNMASEGQPKDMKWCLHFKEFEKPMSLNSTNGQLIAQITGSEDFDGWIGKKVELYNDPSVSFGGKLTGGIRVRRAAGTPSNIKGPTVWTLDQAVAECIKVDITRPRLIEALKNAGNTGYSPERDTGLVMEMIEAAKAEQAFAAIPSAEQSFE